MTSQKQGKLIVFSAPSGAGKTTIVKKVMENVSSLSFSVSACSRPIRKGEKDGVDYYFLDASTFRARIEAGEFLEWEEVYPGRFYGTLHSEVQRIWDNGKNVVFDVDVIGGLNIKAKYHNKALAVFVMPPSTEILEQRLRKRSLDSDSDIETRLNKATEEIGHAEKFDRILINDDLDMAVEEAVNMVKDFLEDATEVKVPTK